MPGDVLHPTPTAYRKGYSVTSTIIDNIILAKKYFISIHGMGNYSVKSYYSPQPYVYVATDAEYITDTYKLSSTLSKNFGLITPEIGAEYLIEGYATSDNINENNSIGKKERRSFSYWLEVPVNYTVSEDLKIYSVGSLRNDRIDSKGMNNKSIENTISYLHRRSRFALAFGYSEAFRMPTFLDLYWMRSAFAEGNPDLAPEITVKKHVKLNYILEFDQVKIDLSSDFFTRDIDSVIIWVRSFNGIYKPINSNSEETTGREDYCSLRYKNFQFRWINTVLESKHVAPGEYLDGMYIPFKPKYLQQTSISYTFKKITCEIVNRMVGKRYTLAANTKWTSPYSVWDISLGWRKSFSDWILTSDLTIGNIDNEEYEILVDYPMPGRTFSINFGLIYEKK